MLSPTLPGVGDATAPKDNSGHDSPTTEVVTTLPAGRPAPPDEIVEQMSAAREIAPDTFAWVLNLARSRAKATLDANKADFKKGRLREKTYRRNLNKWNATIEDIDQLLTLARV